MRDATTIVEPKAIFKNAPLFSSFAVKDLDAAREFYRNTIGLDVREVQKMGLLEIHGRELTRVMVYPKPDHQPALFTVLNLPVRDIDEAVDALTSAGVKFERYDTADIKTDAKGIARAEADPSGTQGPSIAWFRDPSGNIVSVLEDRQS
jgi:catechol 2,3-dioxygenase-like lactoylglutathione lyase family enzyme